MGDAQKTWRRAIESPMKHRGLPEIHRVLHEALVSSRDPERLPCSKGDVGLCLLPRERKNLSEWAPCWRRHRCTRVLHTSDPWRSGLCKSGLWRRELCKSGLCKRVLHTSALWCHRGIAGRVFSGGVHAAGVFSARVRSRDFTLSLQECSLEEGSPPASRRARRSLDEGSRRRHHDPLLTPMFSSISLAGSERTRNVGMHDGGQKPQKWGVLNTLFHLYGQTSTTEKTFPIAEPGISGILTEADVARHVFSRRRPQGKRHQSTATRWGPWKKARCKGTVPPLKGDIDDGKNFPYCRTRYLGNLVLRPSVGMFF